YPRPCQVSTVRRGFQVRLEQMRRCDINEGMRVEGQGKRIAGGPELRDAPGRPPRCGAGAGRVVCSVVVPVYNERENVHAMHHALCDAVEAESGLDWEFLFVDDGSTDNTFALLSEINRTDPRVKAVRLSRNHGSHVAAAAGLQFASGDAAVVMAGDLQDHPREISRFLAKWREGFQVVWGVRATRQDPRLHRILAALYSRVI